MGLALAILAAALLGSLAANIALVFILVKHVRGESERLTAIAETAMRTSKATSATEAANAEIVLKQAAIGLEELQKELSQETKKREEADQVVATNGKKYAFSDLEPLSLEEILDAQNADKMYG